MTKLIEFLTTELRTRGWFASDLARASGVSDAAISNVLSGSRGAGPDLCNKLARGLKLPSEIIFRMAGLLEEPSTTLDPDDLTQDVTYHQLVDILKQMTVSERRELYEYARYRHQRPRSTDP